MPIRIKQQVSIAVSSNPLKENKDLGNIEWDVKSDGLGEGGTSKTLVPASTTDLEIRLDNIASVSFLAIRTSAKDANQSPVSLDFKKDADTGEPITITPLPSTKEGHFLLTTSSITALYVTNSSAVDMEVIVIACGD